MSTTRDFVAGASPRFVWIDHAGDEQALPAQRLQLEVIRMHRALHEIAEEWAGAECGEPVTAQEAYVIALVKRMYAMAVDGLPKP